MKCVHCKRLKACRGPGKRLCSQCGLITALCVRYGTPNKFRPDLAARYAGAKGRGE